jgi:hypothetical protein
MPENINPITISFSEGKCDLDLEMRRRAATLHADSRRDDFIERVSERGACIPTFVPNSPQRHPPRLHIKLWRYMKRRTAPQSEFRDRQYSISHEPIDPPVKPKNTIRTVQSTSWSVPIR